MKTIHFLGDKHVSFICQMFFDQKQPRLFTGVVGKDQSNEWRFTMWRSGVSKRGGFHINAVGQRKNDGSQNKSRLENMRSIEITWFGKEH